MKEHFISSITLGLRIIVEPLHLTSGAKMKADG